MIIKIYALIWLLVVGSAMALFFTGNFTEITLTVFGFIAATHIATGITVVLPWWVDKTHTWTYKAG